ncbi:hypothetical protein C4588_06275 [Candidatus Parcubacteria bacterium]|nr:MAG: hypothetical protein C4588_06275 [Candidatus Parcubacteria bacterium]
MTLDLHKTGLNRVNKLHNGAHGQGIESMLGSKRWGGGSSTTRIPDRVVIFSDGINGLGGILPTSSKSPQFFRS